MATLIGVFSTLVSVISSAIAVVSAVCNNISVNKISEKKIDADIKSNARIEWIQNVRTATVEFEDSFRDLYICAFENSANPLGYYNPELEKALTNYRHKIYMLILYFGYRNKISNSAVPGKPNNQFSIANEMCTLASSCDDEDAGAKFKEDKQRIAVAKKENSKIIDKLLDGARKNNSGLTKIIANYLQSLLGTSCNISFGSKDKDANWLTNSRCYDNIDTIKYYVELLVPIISIYLKIEWDRAKNVE